MVIQLHKKIPQEEKAYFVNPQWRNTPVYYPCTCTGGVRARNLSWTGALSIWGFSTLLKGTMAVLLPTAHFPHFGPQLGLKPESHWLPDHSAPD